MLEQKCKLMDLWCPHCTGTGLSGCDVCLTKFRNDLEKPEPKYASLENIPKVPCMYCKRADEAARANCDHCNGTGWDSCVECFYNCIDEGGGFVLPINYKDIPRVPCSYCEGSGIEAGRAK